MKRTFLYFIFFILIITNQNKVFGQPDHLQPAGNIFTTITYQLEYYLEVKKILIDCFPGTIETQFLMLPSFFPERYLCIIGDGSGEYFEINYSKSSRSIFSVSMGADTSRLTVSRYSKIIDKPSVELIKSVYSSALKKMKTRTDSVWRPDGTTYFFTANMDFLVTGVLQWNTAGENMKELISVNEYLIYLVETTKDSTVYLEESFKARFNKLKVNLDK